MLPYPLFAWFRRIKGTYGKLIFSEIITRTEALAAPGVAAAGVGSQRQGGALARLVLLKLTSHQWGSSSPSKRSLWTNRNFFWNLRKGVLYVIIWFNLLWCSIYHYFSSFTKNFHYSQKLRLSVWAWVRRRVLRGFQCRWRSLRESLAGRQTLVRKHCSKLTDNRERVFLPFDMSKGKKTHKKNNKKTPTTAAGSSSRLLIDEKTWNRRGCAERANKWHSVSFIDAYSKQSEKIWRAEEKNKTEKEKKKNTNAEPNAPPTPSPDNNKSIRSNSAGGCIHIPSALVSSKTFRASQLKLH